MGLIAVNKISVRIGQKYQPPWCLDANLYSHESSNYITCIFCSAYVDGDLVQVKPRERRDAEIRSIINPCIFLLLFHLDAVRNLLCVGLS
jgi:hypothetical protein